MKTLPYFATAAIALLSLAACDHKTEEVTGVTPDPMASQMANAAPVELPPTMTADVSLRCGDNSLIYVVFFKGDKQVVVRTEKNGTPTVLKAPEAGQPYVSDSGWKLTGNSKAVSVTAPGKPAKSCHA